MFLEFSWGYLTVMSKMMLSSIEGSLRIVFQDYKNESSDVSRVRQSEFIADITSDFSNLSHQEQGQLIMPDNNETRDTSLTAGEMPKGLSALGVDQVETSMTTSLVAGEVSTKLICNDGDHIRKPDSSVDYVSLKQLDQDRLNIQEEERADMGTIKLPGVESISKKVVSGNEEQNRQTDSSGDRAEQTVISSQTKRSSNHAWIYDKRGSVRSNNKRRKGKSMQHSFCHSDRAKSTNSLYGADSFCVDAESDENQEEKYIVWLDYGATVEWNFELTADQRIQKSLAGQGKRHCTRAYAKLFGSTPKRIRAFHVEMIVAKKDVDMKLEVNENRECNEVNWLKNVEVEIEVVKLIEERQVESHLKDNNCHLIHAALSETNLASTINKEMSCKLINSDAVGGSVISNPVFIQFGNQSEVRCDQPITFPLIVQGRDLLAVSDKEGSKENGSDIGSSATATNPVLKKMNDQFQVRRERVTTSSLNFQGRHLAIVTKEVKNKSVIPGVKVQNAKKRKVSSAFSSTSNGRFSPNRASILTWHKRRRII
ncbi:OLC1v1005057C1 [Oldenlandia corymbosa var. corymbosa]|uniref:OLC1v1005057C1 n=1 Tax=Oldenlandia corymbosa var. corymbosa TaxID=529605 RepID=A0AAV1DDT9_OLDCO|nr:OLC1v1005057C1 [Oldenlandia corymbosa var. corymbosa]